MNVDQLSGPVQQLQRDPSVNVRVYLDAAAPPAALDELHQLVLRTSPVGNTITKPVEINAELVQR